MSEREYTHLHLHTHYSILDGVCQVAPLIARAKELGFKNLAITDHGSMYGCIDFYKTAEKKGIKPIIGFEAYVAPGSRLDKQSHGVKDASYHLVLLAKNMKGYLNLSQLCTAGYLEGFYYRPRIDKEILRQHSEGIIALSGCLSGEVSRYLLHDNFAEAERAAEEYRDILGADNFYLEMQDNGLPEQKKIIAPMAELSRKTGIPLVATSDVHYILPEHAKVQDVMICINTGKKLSDENRMKMDSEDFYLKSADEMFDTFKDYPEACENTVKIAARCNFDLEELHNDEHGNRIKFHLPVMTSENGETVEETFRRECEKGLEYRYGRIDGKFPEAVQQRYDKESKVILEMGFPSYFLMVAEIVQFAKDSGIPVGPGRGSAAGSIVAYAMRITDLDPLKYDLLFERFLNEGRNEMPDIDIDFDVERRAEVVQFIKDRFGHDHCSQIITYGKISAKSAIRDVGRVMDIPLHEVNTIAKMIPDGVKAKNGFTSIQNAMKENPDLADVYEKDPIIKEMLDMSGELDGVIRQTGIHAAGVLVADRPLAEFYGPLAKRGDDITFQYDMKKVEVLGLCKVDVLGLETLTLIRKALDIIKLSTGDDVDINNIPIDDKKTFQMLSKGDSKGVFQFESDGFRALLTKMRPDRFEDLVAGVAMYRPGPLGCGMVDRYIDCKHKRAEPNYLHPLLKGILGETHGEVLYQEQVQALALQLAHFTLSEGDLMRRAMGKKIKEIMDEYKGKFVKQAHDTVGEDIASQIFDQVEQFAAYGFNKSHSACYAFIAYQTAWLKAHYPVEYIAALLTINRGNSDKVVQYTDDAKHLGIALLPPDINESGAYFTVTRDKDIRYGLSAIKGVGDKAVESLEEERKQNGEFTSIYDFCERVDLHKLNKGSIEAIIKAGGFDSLGGHRAQYIAALEQAIAAGQTAQKDRNSGQMNLFGEAEDIAEPELPAIPEWDEQLKLQMEKEVLGMYVSSHPLAKYETALKVFSNARVNRLKEANDGAFVTIGGMISSVNVRLDKKERRYAQIVLDDLDASVRVMVFSSQFEEYKELLEEDKVVFIQGKLDLSRDEPSILSDKIIAIENAIDELAGKAIITLQSENYSSNTEISSLKECIAAHHGKIPLYFSVNTLRGKTVTIKTPPAYCINPTEDFATDLRNVLGEGNLHYTPMSQPQNGNGKNGRKRRFQRR